MTVSPMVQPSQMEPVNYFIEDSNYIIFGSNLTQKKEIHIAEFQVETDTSAFPWETI